MSSYSNIRRFITAATMSSYSNIRRFITAAAPGVATSIAGIAAILPATVFVDNYMEMTQSYKRGFPVKVSSHAQKLFDEVKEDLSAAISKSQQLKGIQLLKNKETINPRNSITDPSKPPDPVFDKFYSLNEENMNYITPYTVFGFDMHTLGWIKYKIGCKIGIPENFARKNGEELLTYGIHVDNKPVSWFTPDGVKLKESMKLSDEAKKFAIASSLLQFFQWQTETNVITNCIHVAVPIAMKRTIDLRYQLHSKARPIRYLVNTLIAVFAVSSWLVMKDIRNISNQRTVDKAMATLDESYLRGGVEYYSKTIGRNLALRAMMGDYGQTIYTSLGNDRTLIRTPCLPVVERSSFFSAALVKCRQDKLNAYGPVVLNLD